MTEKKTTYVDEATGAVFTDQYQPVALPTARDRNKNLRVLIEKAAPSIKTLLPKIMTPERFGAILFNSCQKNPLLLECDHFSIIKVGLQCAMLGVEPDTPLQQAHIIPYKGKATLQLGYRGLIELARRSNTLANVIAYVVHQSDDFDFALGDTPFVRHRPFLGGDPGEFVAVYGILVQTSGGKVIDIMSKHDVEKIRARAQAKSGPAWSENFDEMAKKTLIKRMLKVQPQSAELARALELDNAAEVGDRQVFDTDIEELLPETETTKTDKLAEKVKGDS